jgi:two-component system LytT family response regulator
MSALRAIVVDDELLAREGLSADLQRLGVEVIATCGDGYSAREAIARLGPDLLFLDVDMPEVDGFAVLEGLEPENIPPATIFVTAYDQHALRAFEARALDYLLKPVAPVRLRDAVERAAQRVKEARALRDASSSPQRADTESSAPYLTQLVVRDRDQVTIIPVSELEWVEGETYYVRLHASGARPRLLRERMSVLESRLDPERFLRTHRSAIVRLDLVRAIRTISRYEHSVVLSTGANVPLSRDRRARLETLLAENQVLRHTP